MRRPSAGVAVGDQLPAVGAVGLTVSRFTASSMCCERAWPYTIRSGPNEAKLAPLIRSQVGLPVTSPSELPSIKGNVPARAWKSSTPRRREQKRLIRTRRADLDQPTGTEPARPWRGHGGTTNVAARPGECRRSHLGILVIVDNWRDIRPSWKASTRTSTSSAR